MKTNSEKIADICQWVGTDGFLYLQIMEMFNHAENATNSEVAKGMNDSLHMFHAYCEKIVEKVQH